MRRDPTILVATPFTRLPAAMRHSGEPSRWAKMTRPGQSMHSFIEGAFFTDDGALWLTDVPYGRIFRVDPDGNWRVTHQYEGEPHSMRFDADGRPMIADYSLGLIKLEGTNTSRQLREAEIKNSWAFPTCALRRMGLYGSQIPVARVSATLLVASMCGVRMVKSDWF